MSTSFELIIKPGRSKLYFRLVFLLYLISFLLILQSSIPLALQSVLIVFFVFHLRRDWAHQRPCMEIKEMIHRQNEWLVVDVLEQTTVYERLQILIHNPLFLLIKLENSNDQRFLVLFQDQLPQDQIRLLFLRAL